MLFKASLLAVVLPALTYAASIKSRQACPNVMTIFARGTGEPESIGVFVGPYFDAALQSALGSKSSTFIGVEYPASIIGYLEGGDPAGARTMAADVTSAANLYPDTHIVMSGYRQGFSVPCMVNEITYINI